MSSSVNCKNGDKNLQENGSDKFDDSRKELTRSRKEVQKVKIPKNSSPLHSTSADSDSNSMPNANDKYSIKSSERNLPNGSAELQFNSNVQHFDAEKRNEKADKPDNLVGNSTLVGIFNN